MSFKLVFFPPLNSVVFQNATEVFIEGLGEFD